MVSLKDPKDEEKGLQMSEEIKNTTEETPKAEGTVESGNKTPKLFSEEEVSEIVQNRLARKKLDVDAVKSDYENQVKEQEAVIQSYEGILKEIINSKLADIPTEYKELVGKLSLSEQWEFINKQDKSLAPKKIVPSTPIPNKAEGQEIVASEKTKNLKIF